VAHEPCLGWDEVVHAVATGRYGGLLTRRRHTANGAAIVGVWILANGGRAYLRLRGVASGLDEIALGLLFFLLAALISGRKAGILERWRARLAKTWPPLE
jgi:hypothetical protein